jgi:hypothetical protein
MWRLPWFCHNERAKAPEETGRDHREFLGLLDLKFLTVIQTGTLVVMAATALALELAHRPCGRDARNLCRLHPLHPLAGDAARPATVAFAIPIYEQRATIRRYWPTLALGVTVQGSTGSAPRKARPPASSWCWSD